MSAPPDGGTVFGVVTLPSVAAVRARLISRRLRLVGDTGRPLHMVATGRTGSGKTTLGNRLLGIDYFRSDGGQDCTREVNHIRFPGGLLYSDLPGVCSDDQLENFNRAALGLSQVEDYPNVPTLTVATFSNDRLPDRQDHPVDQFAAAHPPPDLLLYVVAADKQFTSADRRYLKDLLAHHKRVVYVLNLFSTSSPTRANIHDVVSKIATIHRAMSGVLPPLVLMDCRTGDGLAELLSVARQMLDDDHGQLLTDLIADQERSAPGVFSAEVCQYLIGVAATAAVIPAGPPGGENPIHRLSIGLWRAVDDLRNWVDAGDVGGITPYRPLVAEALGSASEAATDAMEGLLDLVQGLAVNIYEATARQRNAIRDLVTAALSEWQVEITHRQQLAIAAANAFITSNADQSDRKVEVERRRQQLEDRFKRVQEADRNLQVRKATLDHEGARHDRDRESLDDQIDDFNYTVGRPEGQLDASGVNRVGDRLNREAARINRRAETLNREARSFNRDVDEHHDEVLQAKAEQERFNELVRDFNTRVHAVSVLRDKALRLAHANRQSEAAFLWAKERCLSNFYPAEAELSVRLSEFRDRLCSTVRRASGAPGADDSSDRFRRLEVGLRGAATDLLSRAHGLRAHFARLRLDRVCDRLLAKHTKDHFDEQGDGGHRGSTYTPLAADAAALIFATVHAAAIGKSGLDVLDRLVEQYQITIGELPKLTLDAVNSHLSALSDLFCPEFKLAIARLVFVTNQLLVG